MWAYLCAKYLSQILPYTAIIALRILVPVNAIDTAPCNHNIRLFAKLAGSIFLSAHAAADIPDLLGFDFAAVFVEGASALGDFAHLDFEMGDYAVVVLAKTLAFDVAHFGHHGFCLADLGALCRALFEGWLIGVAHRYIGAFEANRWC